MNIPTKINVDIKSKTVEKAMDIFAKAGYVFYEPTRIKKIASAEKDALITKTKGKIEAMMLQDQAVNRLALTEIARQRNINSITQKALKEVDKSSGTIDAKTDVDWVRKYFSFSQDVSKEDMQDVWAKVLAGEFKESGSFSYKTMSILANLRSEDAKLFSKLCSYTVHVLPEKQVPLIFSGKPDASYNENMFSFEDLQYLDGLGLIHFENISGFSLTVSSAKNMLIKCNSELYLIKTDEDKIKLSVGKVLLTREGKELLGVIDFKSFPKLIEIVKEKWITTGRSIETVKSLSQAKEKSK